ncbi:hypothetical protein CYY_001457 [Polysphondylium violaceum]|uniref:G domain-containing protein n=1 Tax=Polysphondylium violaceum TaxID=133409 RepID=A0A8J4PY84_9MYCE|nr:hypothetical protein CYY_001457 [Polysphondylium violaceum]
MGIVNNNNIEDKVIISFLGNPGSGKSTLANCIMNGIHFPSGITSGTGMTKDSKIVYWESNHYIQDTPGLEDVVYRQSAAQAIENALKREGLHKIIFIITMESGRIQIQDIETINTVLNSIANRQDTCFNYGIIINKITPTVSKAITQGNGIQACFELLEKRPTHVLGIPRLDEIEDQDNMITNNTEFISKIKDFLQDVKPIKLEVDKLNIDHFDQRLIDLEFKFNEKLIFLDQLKETAIIESLEWDEKLSSIIPKVETIYLNNDDNNDTPNNNDSNSSSDNQDINNNKNNNKRINLTESNQEITNLNQISNQVVLDKENGEEEKVEITRYEKKIHGNTKVRPKLKKNFRIKLMFYTTDTVGLYERKDVYKKSSSSSNDQSESSTTTTNAEWEFKSSFEKLIELRKYSHTHSFF